MKTKIISAVLAVVTVFGGAAAPLSAAAELTDTGVVIADALHDFEYAEFADGTLRITAYTGSDTNVSVPEKIAGKTVTVIGSKAFYGTSVVSITLPDTVTIINEGAFWGAQYLTDINLPDKINTIPVNAFRDCTALSALTIPESVSTIENDAFRGCTSLTGIDVADDNKSFTAIDGVIYSSDMKTLVYVPSNRTTYKIPNTVTTIDGAFRYNTGLTEIALPKSVKECGTGTFVGCTALTTAVFSDGGVLNVPAHCFEGCSALTDVTIPTGMKAVQEYAFYECSALPSIELPSTVQQIGDRAFYGCTSMTEMVLDLNINSIGEEAVGFAYIDGETDVIDGFTIKCYKNSPADKYAKKNGVGVSYYAQSIKNATVKVNNKTCTGKALKPGVTVTLGGTVLTKGTDYTVTYSNNVDPGTGKVTVTGKGAYKDKVTGTFAVKPKQVKKIKLAAKGGRKIKAFWTKYSKVSGYQLQISKKSDFSSATRTANIAGGTVNSRLMSNFAGGKKYYARIRAYVTVNGKKYYGVYSPKATVVCEW